jgi:hypothetical protein
MKQTLSRIFVVIGFILCTTWTSVSSAANLVVNGGFETPVLAGGVSQLFTPGQAIGAWTVIGNAGTNVTITQNAYSESFNNVSQFNAEEGLNSLDITGASNQGSSAGVEQLVATIAGQQYQLSLWVGRVTPTGGPGGVYATPATVDLSINGGARGHFTNSNITNGMINWQQFSTTFTAIGSSTTIDFLNGTTDNNEAGLDNVALATVPEPCSAVLAAFGVIGLAAVYFGRGTK